MFGKVPGPPGLEVGRRDLGAELAQRISKLSTETPTAAISSDGRLLAVAEDTDAGFQVRHEMQPLPP